MMASIANFWGQLPRKIANFLLYIINIVVFFFLDFLDYTMCIFYRYIDEFLEGKSTPCYCEKQNQLHGISTTLFGRKNVFREMGFVGNSRRKFDEDVVKTKSGELGKSRWSDCGCDSCVSWMNNGGDQKLHVVVKDSSKGNPFLLLFIIVHLMTCLTFGCQTCYS